jgi:putative ABC transport system ATP-binding protein
VAEPTRAAGAPLILLENVTKSYPLGASSLCVLDDVSLSVDAGEFVAIMGASGSGKSTLMNVLGCLDRPTSGRYQLQGRDVSGLSRSELARVRNELIGFVFQSFNLLARTSALENVELPLVYAGVARKERLERARAALERVGLGDRLEHHPSQLSGGQQQRVAIARALVNQPRFLLADEPTGNLDSRTSAAIMALFQELHAGGLTIIYVTHDAELARYASRVITLLDGRVVQDVTQKPRDAAELSALTRVA